MSGLLLIYKAEVALGINVFASFMGNNLGLVLLLLTMPFFVKLSMMFGPWEMFWFGIFGVFIAANLSEGDTIKGLIAATAGLVLGCVGLDPIDGSPRFAFGTTYLVGGIPLIPAMIGLYGFTEVFSGLTDISVKSFPLKKTSLIGAAKLWWKYRWLSVRTSILGYIIGVAPGIGANVSCWVGYDHARSTSKEPEKFGKGSIEGLIGSETCNMANVPGAYAPVLSLSIPGDAPTAIMLGILMIHGVRPGPTFLLTNSHWLYEIAVALFLAGYIVCDHRHLCRERSCSHVCQYAQNRDGCHCGVSFVFWALMLQTSTSMISSLHSFLECSVP